MHRDDFPTAAAIAILAMCVATAAHEAIGHGGVCLAEGGAITRLTSAYFQCGAPGTWVAAGGPAGNLAAAVLAWPVWRAISPQHARARLFCALVAALSLFWFAGQFFSSAALNEGDLYFVARDLVGSPPLALRIAAAIVGILLYVLGMRFLRAANIPHATRAVAWLAAALAACAAALAYAPDRLGALTQTALEIGAASLPLLIVRETGGEKAPAISRSWPWIVTALAAYLAFVLTLGAGLP
jgi:hypothetical protein